MNSGRIKNSARLKRIAEILMRAEHPLSAQEISQRAYPNSKDKIMLNVSTNIGEMRSEENRLDGYVVSFSTTWRVASLGLPGKRTNKDSSITFFIQKSTRPWHDGRPRYWIKAAPRWSPAWIVDDNGNIVVLKRTEEKAEPIKEQMQVVEMHPCPGCGEMVSGDSVYHNDDCRKLFYQKLGTPNIL